MTRSPAYGAPCSTCGKMLNAEGVCLACLVRAGFDQPIAELASPVFGDFEIVRRKDGSFWELGRGAMGVTYRAEDKVLNRSVALKVINAPAAEGAGQAVRDRFLREARAAAAFRHPNVAGVFHFGVSPAGDGSYYAMELVEGETLEALVRRDGPLKINAALEMAIQVTRALIAAAAHGLIHRDLKPGNIMLTRSDAAAAELEVKVIDFGLAKAIADGGKEMDLTKGGFIGTPAFASPEQFSGAPADARSDIYSLGVTLWYALTGEVPYGGKTIEEIRHFQSDLPLPMEKLVARKIPTSVIQLLRRILAVDPVKRPASARELMEFLELCRARSGTRRRAGKFALFVATAAGVAALLFWRSGSMHDRAVSAALPQKSIAVLPFQNLSDDTQNSYFTEGVHDEILAHLARVADLKVISYASVMTYPSGATRTRGKISRELGVAHLLEGTVQRANGRVRISAQLIDARTDAHLWAEHYDRELADVFGIQTEVAEKIVQQLKAKISPGERAAMGERPTHDLAAYDLYLRARNLIDAVAFSARAKENLFEATHLLQEAVERDPAFILAHYQLARAQDQIYFLGIDHTPERLVLADAAVQETLRLRPDSGEAHLALAQHLYWGYRDYDRALEELALARRTLPNEPLVLVLAGYIDRRQGRWEQSIEELEQALELDPRSVFILQQISFNYENMRHYQKMDSTLARVLAIAPKDTTTRVQRAIVQLEWRANSRPLHSVIQNIIAEDSAAAATVAEQWMRLALCERDGPAARQVLATLGAEGSASLGIRYPKAWSEGIVARAAGDSDGARAAFTAARAEMEKTVREQPAYAQPLSLLGMIDAALGRKEEAIAEGRRAIELLPVSKDAMAGAALIENLALIYAWTGEKERACNQLVTITSIPYDLSYGRLRLHPFWDPLRGDSCFENIVASLAPK